MNRTPLRKPSATNRHRISRVAVAWMMIAAQFAVLLSTAPGVVAEHDESEFTLTFSGMPPQEVEATADSQMLDALTIGIEDTGAAPTKFFRYTSVAFTIAGHVGATMAATCADTVPDNWEKDMDGDALVFTSTVGVTEGNEASFSACLDTTATTGPLTLTVTVIGGNAASTVNADQTHTETYPVNVAGATDEEPPALDAITTADSDADGQLDQISVRFDEDLGGTTVAGDWQVAGYSITAAAYVGNTATLTLTPSGAPDTGATPDVSYSGTTLTDTSDNAAAAFGPTAATDGASPVLVAAATVGDGNGGVASVDLTWSEPTGGFTGFAAGDFTVGGAAATGGTADQLTFNTIMNTGVTPSVAYSPGLLADAAGNAAAATAATATDDAAPLAKSGKTVDSDGDNQVDGIAVTFSETISGTTTAADWASPDFTISSTEPTIAGAIVTVALDEDGTGTQATGNISYAGTGLQDAAGKTAPARPDLAVASSFSLTVISVVTGGTGDGNVSSVELTWNDAVNGFDHADFTVNGAAATAGSLSSDRRTATLTFPGIVGTDALPTIAYNGDAIKNDDDVAFDGAFAATTDGVGPVLLTAVTVDADQDGTLDGVTVTFSEPVAAATDARNWTVDGTTATSVASAGADSITIAYASTTSDNTDATPALLYIGDAAAIVDAEGVALDTNGPSGLVAADAAAPVIVAFEGGIGSDRAEVIFSEPVFTAAGGITLDDLEYGNVSADDGAADFASVTHADGESIVAATLDAPLVLEDLDADNVTAVGTILDAAGLSVIAQAVNVSQGPIRFQAHGNAGSDQVTVVFNRDVDGSKTDTSPVTKRAFSLTVPGATGAAIASAWHRAGEEVLLNLTTTLTADQLKQGTAIINLGDDRVFDAVTHDAAPSDSVPILDVTAPTPLSASTMDKNGNGTIDHINVTFDELLDEEQALTGLEFSNVTGKFVVTGATVYGASVHVAIAPKNDTVMAGTNITPDLVMVGVVIDLAGNAAEGDVPATTDGAPAILASATTDDFDGDGRIDAYHIGVSEDLELDTVSKDHWSVEGRTVLSAGADCGPATTSAIYLCFTQGATFDTKDTPRVSYDGGVHPMNDTTGISFQPADIEHYFMGAKARIAAVEGTLGSTAISVYFSEPVTPADGTWAASDFLVDGFQLAGLDGDAPSGATPLTRVDLLAAAPLTADQFDNDTVTVSLFRSTLGVSSPTGDREASFDGKPITVAGSASVSSAETRDLRTGTGSWNPPEPDGHIDRVRIVFNDAFNNDTFDIMNFHAPGLNWERSNETNAAFPVNRTFVVLELDPGVTPDTGALPEVTMHTAGLRNWTGHLVPLFTMTAADAAKPRVMSAATADNNGDGSLDNVTVTLSEHLAGTTLDASSWSVDGVPALAAVHQFGIVTLQIPEGTYATDATPLVEYADSSAVDAAGNALAAGSVTAADAAAPVVLSARSADYGGHTGYLDNVTTVWSEPLNLTRVDLGNVTVDGVSVFGVWADPNDSRIVHFNITENLNDGPDTGATPTLGVNWVAVPDTAVPANFAVATQTEAADGMPPFVTHAKTRDADEDGILDSYHVWFSEPVNDTTIDAADWMVDGATVTTAWSGSDDSGGNDTRIVINFTSSLGTGELPNITYDGTSLHAMDGNAIQPHGDDDIPEWDGAGPVALSATTGDPDGWGIVSEYTVSFSEALAAVDHVDILIDGGTGSNPRPIEGAQPNEVLVRDISNFGAFATNETPRLDAAAGLAFDAAGNAGPAINGSNLDYIDGAAPVFSAVQAYLGTKNLKLTFSEPVTAMNGSALTTDQLTFSSDNGIGANSIETLMADDDGVTWYATTDEVILAEDLNSDSIRVSHNRVKEANGDLLLPSTVRVLDDSEQPKIVGIQTFDDGGGGSVDSLVIQFTEAMNVTTAKPSAFKVDGANATGVQALADSTMILVSFVGSDGTSYIPSVTIDSGAINDTSDGAPALGYNATETEALTTDGAAPVLWNARTQDTDQNGHIDGLLLRFSEDVSHDEATAVDAWTVAGYNVTGMAASDQDHSLLLSLEEGAMPDTDVTPRVDYDATASPITDAAGNGATNTTRLEQDVYDYAAPVLLIMDGRIGSTEVNIRFSEPVSARYDQPLQSSNFDYLSTNQGTGNIVGTLTQDGDGSTWTGHVNKPLTRADFDHDTLAATDFDDDEIIDANWNAADASIRVHFSDATPPAIDSIVTQDLDANGRIDALLVTFDEAIHLLANNTHEWQLNLSSVQAYNGTGDILSATTPAGSDNQVLVAIAEGTALDTSEGGISVHYLGTNITDQSSSRHLLPIRHFISAADGAGPAVLRATTFDADRDGWLDSVTLDLSEPATGTGANRVLVAGAKVSSVAHLAGNRAVVHLDDSKAPRLDTGALPNVTAGTTTITDAAGNKVQFMGPIVDGAAPVLLSALALPGLAELTVTFSEPVFSDDAASFGLLPGAFRYTNVNGANTLNATETGDTVQFQVGARTGTVSLNAPAHDQDISGGDALSAIKDQVYDAAANTLASDETVDITKNPLKPGGIGLTSTFVAGQWSNQASGSFSWKTPEGYPSDAYLDHYEYVLKRGTTVIDSNADYGKSRTKAITVTTDGTYTFTVKAVGTNSRTVQESLSFNVDTTPPTVPAITSSTHSSDECRSDRNATWSWGVPVDDRSGTKTASTGIKLGTTTLNFANGTHTADNLTDGVHTVTLSTEDNAGNRNSTTHTVKVDNAAPVVAISVPAIATGHFNVSWSASDVCGASSYEIQYRKGTGAWTELYKGNATTTMAEFLINQTTRGDGAYQFRGKATDTLGHAGSYPDDANVTANTTVDATAPTAPGSPSAINVAGGTVRVSWTAATDAGTGVDAYQVLRRTGSSGAFTQVASLSGTTLVYVEPKANTTDGLTYGYQVLAIDGAGNQGPKSATATVTVDHEQNTVTASATSLTKLSQALGVTVTSLKAKPTGSGSTLDSIEASGISLHRVVRIAGLDAANDAFMLARTGQRPAAFWIPATDEVIPITGKAGTVTNETLTSSALEVAVTIDDKVDGEWIEVEVIDPYADTRTLLHVKAGERTLSGDSIQQIGGKVYILDDPETTYILAYGLLADEKPTGDDKNPGDDTDPGSSGLAWWVWLLIGLGVLAVIGGGVGYYLYQRREDANWA